MKFKTFVLCRLLRRHQWKFIRPYSDLEIFFGCRQCGVRWKLNRRLFALIKVNNAC